MLESQPSPSHPRVLDAHQLALFQGSLEISELISQEWRQGAPGAHASRVLHLLSEGCSPCFLFFEELPGRPALGLSLLRICASDPAFERAYFPSLAQTGFFWLDEIWSSAMRETFLRLRPDQSALIGSRYWRLARFDAAFSSLIHHQADAPPEAALHCLLSGLEAALRAGSDHAREELARRSRGLGWIGPRCQALLERLELEGALEPRSTRPASDFDFLGDDPAASDRRGRSGRRL